MRSARSALHMLIAIALATLVAPAAAKDAQRGQSVDMRLMCVRWDADAATPVAYSPVEGRGCAAVEPTDSASGPSDHEALARLDHAIGQLQADIDAFRSTTDAAEPSPLRWRITAAGPNHLYYAAHSLLRYTRGTCHASRTPEQSAATLDDVTALVVCVHSHMRQRLVGPDGADVASAPPRPTGESPLQAAARLLERLLATGHRLGTVLPVETASSDLYDRLEDAARNLDGFTAEALPAPGKQAESVADVYQLVFRSLRLSQVLEVKRNLEKQRRGAFALSQWHGVDVSPNMPSLQIDIATTAAGSVGVDLAQVHDVATLLAAQLRAIGDGGYAEAPHPRPPQPTSTDVFRLASVLEAQLMKMTGITVPRGR